MIQVRFLSRLQLPVILNWLLEKAAVKLGELNAFARLVANIDLFIQLHVTKEAVVSSSIKGTQTKMDEAILPEEEVKPEKENDWKEVNNLIKPVRSHPLKAQQS